MRYRESFSIRSTNTAPTIIEIHTIPIPVNFNTADTCRGKIKESDAGPNTIFAAIPKKNSITPPTKPRVNTLYLSIRIVQQPHQHHISCFLMKISQTNL